MSHWMDTALVVITVAFAAGYFTYRCLSRCRSSGSDCAGDCCSTTKQPGRIKRPKDNRRV